MTDLLSAYPETDWLHLSKRGRKSMDAEIAIFDELARRRMPEALLQEHGSHDQRTHGRRGGAGADTAWEATGKFAMRTRTGEFDMAGLVGVPVKTVAEAMVGGQGPDGSATILKGPMDDAQASRLMHSLLERERAVIRRPNGDTLMIEGDATSVEDFFGAFSDRATQGGTMYHNHPPGQGIDGGPPSASDIQAMVAGGLQRSVVFEAGADRRPDEVHEMTYKGWKKSPYDRATDLDNLNLELQDRLREVDPPSPGEGPREFYQRLFDMGLGDQIDYRRRKA